MGNRTASIHKISKQELVKEIRDNYRRVEKTIVEQLYMRNSLHGPTTGYAREDIWKELFSLWYSIYPGKRDKRRFAKLLAFGRRAG